MLNQFIINNKYLNLLLYFVTGMFFWAMQFINPSTMQNHTFGKVSIISNQINHLIINNKNISILIGFIAMLAIAIIIDLISKKFNFAHNKSSLAGIMFIIIIGSITNLHRLHPIYFSAIILTILLYKIYILIETDSVESTTFQIGFLYILSVLFYYQSIIVLPVILIGLYMFRSTSYGQTLAIFIIGMLLPLIFIYSYNYLTDTPTPLMHEIKVALLENHIDFTLDLSSILLFIFLGLAIIISSVKIIQQFVKKKVIFRKYYTMFFAAFIFPVIAYLFVPGVTLTFLLLSIIPITFIVTNYIYYNKRKVVNYVIFIILIGLAFFHQYNIYA